MIIGVTGGIGSGKSTVLRAVARQGYRVYDCDREAKRIILDDPRVREQMIALFGAEVYQDGVYQTQYVARQVFANPDKLHRLNAIVHPAVAEDISRQQSEVRSQKSEVSTALPIERSQHGFADRKKSEVLFVESAILVSSGLAALCDAVVLITAPEEERIERVLLRAAKRGQHMDIEHVRARIHAQVLEEESLRTTPYDLKLVNDDATPITDIVEQLIRFVDSNQQSVISNQ